MKIKALKIAGVILLAVLLVISVGINIYYMFTYDSYLQSKEEIYIMESGMLLNTMDYAEGEDYEIAYDFENAEYSLLLEKYDVAKTAGEGSEFQKALRLMDEYAPRLTHESYFGGDVEFKALPLLEYSLDNPSQGINCRLKSQILNEMLLALEIYSRKVWINPYSSYDDDCHVVNEVWDTTYNKWIMLDITNNQYWIDEEGTPLSVTEIREKGAMQEFCTPVCPGDDLSRPEKLKEKYSHEFLYIMKNMMYFYCCDGQTVGETDRMYMLIAENSGTDYEYLISEESWNRAPLKMED